MKVAIVGASSFIGERIFLRLVKNRSLHVVGTFFLNRLDENFVRLDITDKKAIESFLIGIKPDVVLWIAGSKNVKKCEEDYKYAFQINTQPVLDFLEIAEQYRLASKIVFFSTDYVFDGMRGKYADSDMPNPKTNYGITNYLAEQAIFESQTPRLIIRTSAVMGRKGIFFDWLTASLRSSAPLSMYDDVFFSPTPIEALCDGIENMLQNPTPELLHFCGGVRMSRYEYAVMIKQIIAQSKSEIIPEHMSENIPAFFQRDISLMPSVFSRLCFKKSFYEYIEKEVKNDKVYT